MHKQRTPNDTIFDENPVKSQFLLLSHPSHAKDQAKYLGYIWINNSLQICLQINFRKTLIPDLIISRR